MIDFISQDWIQAGFAGAFGLTFFLLAWVLKSDRKERKENRDDRREFRSTIEDGYKEFGKLSRSINKLAKPVDKMCNILVREESRGNK